jgi:hypothetical protein
MFIVVTAGLSISGVARAQPPKQDSALEERLASHGGFVCRLEAKGGVAQVAPELGDDFDPDADPDAEPAPDVAPAQRYAATEASVFQTCGGLGCLPNLATQDPLDGVCGIAKTVDDCAGAGDPSRFGGLCGEPPSPPPVPKRIFGRRFMVTAQAIIEFGESIENRANLDTALGGLFQHSLTRSRSKVMADGGIEHSELPRMYVHVAAHVSKQRFGHELGFVRKFNHDTLTRMGLSAYGVLWSEQEFVRSPSYRIGPSLSFELLNNLIFRGVWTMGPGKMGPTWMISLEYAAGLWDDFRTNLPRTH